MEEQKPIYQSKTFWFNILAGVVALAGLFGFAEFEPGENAAETIAIVLAAVNLILRYVTKQGVSLKFW